jgi:hypothetical protein
MACYLFQEYPKWVGDALFQDASEDRALRAAEPAAETRVTEHIRPPGVRPSFLQPTLSRQSKRLVVLN